MSKYALVVGCNKFGGDGSNDLAGCVMDAHTWRAFLLGRGFPEANIRMLLDEEDTRDKHLAALDWLTTGRAPGDETAYANSSHGTLAPHGDNAAEQAICCHGVADPRPGAFEAALIYQCDLRTRFSRMPEGVAATLILDCCHAGYRELANPGRRVRYMPPPLDVVARMRQAVPLERELHRDFLSWFRRARKRPAGEIVTPDLPGADPLFFAGCARGGTCADAPDAGGGAFTVALSRSAASAAPGATARTVYEGALSWLRNAGFDQVPQLFGTQAAMDSPFVP